MKEKEGQARNAWPTGRLVSTVLFLRIPGQLLPLGPVIYLEWVVTLTESKAHILSEFLDKYISRHVRVIKNHR